MIGRASGSPRSLTKNIATSPSSTVHGGQHDTKHVTFEFLMHAAFVADEIWDFMLEPASNRRFIQSDMKGGHLLMPYQSIITTWRIHPNCVPFHEKIDALNMWRCFATTGLQPLSLANFPTVFVSVAKKSHATRMAAFWKDQNILSRSFDGRISPPVVERGSDNQLRGCDTVLYCVLHGCSYVTINNTSRGVEIAHPGEL